MVRTVFNSIDEIINQVKEIERNNEQFGLLPVVNEFMIHDNCIMLK